MAGFFLQNCGYSFRLMHPKNYLKIAFTRFFLGLLLLDCLFHPGIYICLSKTPLKRTVAISESWISITAPVGFSFILWYDIICRMPYLHCDYFFPWATRVGIVQELSRSRRATTPRPSELSSATARPPSSISSLSLHEKYVWGNESLLLSWLRISSSSYFLLAVFLRLLSRHCVTVLTFFLSLCLHYFSLMSDSRFFPFDMSPRKCVRKTKISHYIFLSPVLRRKQELAAHVRRFFFFFKSLPFFLLLP